MLSVAAFYRQAFANCGILHKAQPHQRGGSSVPRRSGSREHRSVLVGSIPHSGDYAKITIHAGIMCQALYDKCRLHKHTYSVPANRPPIVHRPDRGECSGSRADPATAEPGVQRSNRGDVRRGGRSPARDHLNASAAPARSGIQPSATGTVGGAFSRSLRSPSHRTRGAIVSPCTRAVKSTTPYVIASNCCR